MHIAIDETGQTHHERNKRFADEYRVRCSCGYRSGANPFRYAIKRTAEWHEINNPTHIVKVQRR